MATQLVTLVCGTRLTFGTNSNTAAITMKNIATGNYVQSAKFDLGLPMAPRYNVRLTNKFTAAPTVGNTCKVWVGFSSSATAATDNSANCSGSDSAYTGYGTNTASAAQGALQLDFVGQLILDAQVGPQDGIIGSFEPRNRYGYLVWQNASGTNTTNVDADHQITLDPVEPRIEAAV